MIANTYRNPSRRRGYCHCAAALLSLILAGCATTGTTRAPAQVNIQNEAGFTITEKARASSGVRRDYDQALAMLDRGQHARGIELLEKVAAAAPDLSAPRIDLGIAHHRAGDLEAAERHLLLALESNPDHPIAHNELGIIYRKTGRFAEARKSYQTALAIYPGFHYARRNLAIVCDLYLADLDCALENYEAYLETVVSDDEASMWLADVQMRMGHTEK